MNKNTGNSPNAPKAEWIDISYPLSKDMVHWPKSPIYPHIEWVYHPTKDNPVTMAQININVHNGTHVDAPRHFFADGKTIDQMPLDAIMGMARVIEIKNPEVITTEELAPHNIRSGERILFKTRNSSLYKTGKFVEDYVYLSNEGAYLLRDKKVSVVGIDYIGIGSFWDKENLFEVHKTLLGSGIWIIETLDLSAVEAGEYELICLPIRLEQGDAAPARAILRPV
jgi:arylformamidase